MTAYEKHNLEILHVDNHVLAVVKPAGVLSQGDSTGDTSMLEYCKEWLKATYNKPGNVFLGLVHRLDRPVGGVMVFGRTSKGAARLSAQFRDRSTIKQYTALVYGAPETPSQTLSSQRDGKPESLEYSTVETGTQTALLLVRPRTGRKHQIRRQLAAIGNPIVGDVRYGKHPPLPNRQIALFAHSLTIVHPTTKELMTFSAPLPEWWPNLS